ncbi:MAG: hypothetical protein IKG36_00575 [Mycoplasmataceae bacterium]|nr:hypothetical protein [Mycoplasmataceae bacterium]MBR3832268.1 hypothetical protein [Mycoplasmataceae bacterium]
MKDVKIQTVLYYRYLMRQTLLVFCFSIFISVLISLLIVFTKQFSKEISIILWVVIWLFPIYVLVFLIMWFIKFKTNKKQLKNLSLFNKITNSAIREKVVKSGFKIKCLIFKSDQDKNFFNAINPEIEKQKKILKIQEEN